MTGLILRGIFLVTLLSSLVLSRRMQLDVSGRVRDFQSLIPIAERDDMIAAYHRRLTGPTRLPLGGGAGLEHVGRINAVPVA